jgi:hypothetical protein
VNAGLLARLRFIDFLLEHFGYAQPKHLIDYFGIATAQATRDLRDYLEQAPGNALYETSTKRYHRSATFERKWP